MTKEVPQSTLVVGRKDEEWLRKQWPGFKALLVDQILGHRLEINENNEEAFLWQGLVDMRPPGGTFAPVLSLERSEGGFVIKDDTDRDPYYQGLPVERDVFTPHPENHLSVRRLMKSGSDLFYLVGEGVDGVLIHRLGLKQAEIWRGLHTGEIRGSTPFDGVVPVAPILTSPQGRLRYIRDGVKAQVVSRFCGLQVGFIVRKLTEGLQGGLSAKLERRYGEVVSELTGDTEMMREALEDLGILHRHLHGGNILGEFVARDYFEKAVTLGGYTVNNIPYSEPNWSFNPLDYVLHPEKWMKVIRIGDWDRAEMKNLPVSTQNALEQEYWSVVQGGRVDECMELLGTVETKLPTVLLIWKDDEERLAGFPDAYLEMVGKLRQHRLKCVRLEAEAVYRRHELAVRVLGGEWEHGGDEHLAELQKIMRMGGVANDAYEGMRKRQGRS